MLSGTASAQTLGQPRSTFVPRVDTPPNLAQITVPVQGKVEPPLPPPPEKKPEVGGGTKDGGTPATGVPAVGGRSSDPYAEYIRLEPPGRERLFGTRDTEAELEARMRQERRDTGAGEPITFPEKPTLTADDYQPRKFDPTVCLREPNGFAYRRLYFEEKNAERYGWDLGPIQPVVSTLAFFKDLALLPMNFGAYPHRRFETNAGQCQPGDPVPYLVYPPEVTGSGLLAEVGVVGLLFYAIP